MAEAGISCSSGCAVQIRSIRDRRLPVRSRTERHPCPEQDTPSQSFAARPSFFTSRGEGEPLLLLHQAPLSHAEYLDATPMLALHFRAIAWDAPGHGNSYVPPQEYEVPDYLRTLHELVNALSLERVHLAGVHSGAAFAKEYAAIHPERTGKIVLGGFGIDPPRPKTERTKAQAFLSRPYSRELKLTRDGGFLLPSWERYVTLAGGGALPIQSTGRAPGPSRPRPSCRRG
ncbi:MAG: alpha/beta hydrolase [Acidobacteria bacterium]|nr:alpha/beta hydrolase [Acidobacteriota bacterium]